MAIVVETITQWWAVIRWVLLGLAVLSIPSVLVQRRGRPTAAVSWVFLLVVWPPVGLFFWWILGRRLLERRRRRKVRAHVAISQRLASLRENEAEDLHRYEERLLPGANNDSSDSRASLLGLNRLPADMAEGVFRPTRNNHVQLLATGHDAFAEVERAIQNAKHHIHALFYIWKNDAVGRRIRDLLAEKARAGVQVRVLCDHFGSPVMGSRFADPLRKVGAQVVRFLPPRWFSLSPRINFRNHRKILVVDGELAIVGGFNIADEYRDDWRDLGVAIRGPAVDQLQEVFADDWYYASKEDLAEPEFFLQWRANLGANVDNVSAGSAMVATVANGPDTPHSSIHDAVFVAINQCQRRLRIATPYFIPTSALTAALRAATYRGVDVEIMLPAKSDVPFVHQAARSYYSDLLAAGVRLYEYQPSMYHAKVTIFDDDLALIGSANFDNRSFRVNFEASCFIQSREFCSSLIAAYEADIPKCRSIGLAELENQPYLSRLADATAGLLSFLT